MVGWLIVNSFVDTPKFHELYDFLARAARAHHIKVEIKTTDALLSPLDCHFGDVCLPDFVLFWDKDIYLARRLEAEGIPLFNSAEAIELCDNKILTALALEGCVKTPKTIIAPKTFEGLGYTKKDFIKKAIALLGLPMVIKEAYGSFGKQVYLAHSFEEASAMVDQIGHKDFLMQEYIAQSHGKDVRINVVGGKVVASILRYNDHDFRSNISNGGSMKPYTPTPAQAHAACQACDRLGLDFAGVDILFGEEDEPIVCEVNSNPHFKSTFDATGIDMSMSIMAHIKGKLS